MAATANNHPIVARRWINVKPVTKGARIVHRPDPRLRFRDLLNMDHLDVHSDAEDEATGVCPSSRLARQRNTQRHMTRFLYIHLDVGQFLQRL